MTTVDKEKVEVLSVFFTSVFRSQTNYPQGTPSPDLEVWDGEQNKAPTIPVETHRDQLLCLDCHKSMGPDGIHTRVLRELQVVIAKLFSTINQPFCSTGGVPGDWNLASVTPIQKKGCTKDLGNYGPVSITLVPGTVR